MELNFEKVGIIFNADIDGAEQLALKISKKFTGAKVFSEQEAEEDISFAIVVGGDGTILKCARKYAPFDVPIFGFNLGRLGFLAQAQPEDVDFAVDRILNKDVRIEERLMLEAEVDGKKIVALNDIVMRGAIFSRTSVLELSINNHPTSNYLADGLIVSTPTGSTAYALSAGGPVVAPSLNCIIIVAICPHTLSTRPLVVPADEIITVKMCENCSKFQVTADGQDGVEIEKTIIIKKHPKSAKLLLLNRETDGFYSVLRKKFYWGRSSRK